MCIFSAIFLQKLVRVGLQKYQLHLGAGACFEITKPGSVEFCDFDTILNFVEMIKFAVLRCCDAYNIDANIIDIATGI